MKILGKSIEEIRDMVKEGMESNPNFDIRISPKIFLNILDLMEELEDYKNEEV